nr:hypothetical protein [uncultured Oscillibacter sp.]
MAIKIEELQQAAAPQGTDSLLLESVSAGTARLSLTDLARFLTEQDNAVKTALSNKAALSAQQTVEKTGVTSRTVEVAAPELLDFILSLPRLLTENLTIKSSGTAGTLDIGRFYGPGSLTVAAKAGETLTIGSVYASGNRAPVSFSGSKFQGAQPYSSTFLTIHSSALFTLNGCAVQGTGKTFDAVNASASSVCLNECGFTGVNRVVIPGCGAMVSFYNCTASDNSVGVFGAGGIVLLAGTTPPLLGGVSNGRHSGGLIVKADGTLI